MSTIAFLCCRLQLLVRHSELEQSETKAQAALVTILSLTQITELKLLLDIGRQGHRSVGSLVSRVRGQQGHGSAESLVSRVRSQRGHRSAGSLVSGVTVERRQRSAGLEVSRVIGRQGHRFYDFVLTLLVACISLEICVGVIIIYIGNLHYYQGVSDFLCI